MAYKGTSPIAWRILILLACVFILAFLLFDEYYLLSGLLLVAIILQAQTLIRQFPDPPGEKGVPESDGTETSSPMDQGIPLTDGVNEAFGTSPGYGVDRDSQSQFYKNIVQHVGIGLLIFHDTGDIEIMNTAARRLLRVHRIRNIEEFRPTNEILVNTLRRLRTGGRELLKLKLGEEIVQLSLYAIELTMRGEHLKLVSLQNIQSELEEKEMEAWQNLVRVLTHEIMNSVTPISSLAGTVEGELKGFMEARSFRVTRDQLSDIQLSMQTITKRSEGLIQFIKEFRSLSNIPKPKVQTVTVKDLLEEIAMLHRKEIREKKVTVTIDVKPEDLTVLADKNMIGQVLINLVKNSLQAFDEEQDRSITLKGFVNDKLRPVISVLDNGPGIDSEALEKIFIPFFTTKKTGSGIGLSLSRQIMRQHQGTLTVNSTAGKGTEFFLRF